jgi:methylated-DNA-[protein]-cysteine S-methyltransferase
LGLVAVSHVRYAADGWGVGELWLDGELLLQHELPRRAQLVSLTNGDHALAARLVAYFAGEPDAFDDVELDLEWCSPFQRAVADALRGVPYGEVVTYGELAALAGRPGAHRAVGTFCARNRFPIVLPCHRVVAADGIGPYGSLGSPYKRRLLELEGVAV